MTPIQVIGGDLESGIWYAKGDGRRAKLTGPRDVSIFLSWELKSVHEITEHNRATLGRVATSVAVGGLVAGPIGALGAAMLFGRQKSITFLAELVDGRQFVASIDHNFYPLLVALAAANCEHKEKKAQERRGGTGGGFGPPVR
jgi:hypothetical protein